MIRSAAAAASQESGTTKDKSKKFLHGPHLAITICLPPLSRKAIWLDARL